MAKIENKTKENPKLEQNKLSDGRISLYLEYYLGREEKPVLDENGNQVYYEDGKMKGKPKVSIKHNRRKENLSLYLIEKPRTPNERQQNKETLELALGQRHLTVLVFRLLVEYDDLPYGGELILDRPDFLELLARYHDIFHVGVDETEQEVVRLLQLDR